MDMFNRCQHKLIDWIGKDQGRCKSCGKVGHWFEDAKLVIWHRGNPKPVAAVPAVLELEASSHPISEHSISASLTENFAAKTG